MMRWIQIAALLLMLAAATITRADIFSEELDTELYDCHLLLLPSARLSTSDSVRLTLEGGGKGNETHVTATREQLVVEAGGKRYGTLPSQVIPGQPYALTIMRRGSALTVFHDDTRMFNGEVPRASGAQASISAGTGWQVEKESVQRLEPVSFADDFMRTKDDNGSWTTARGAWRLHSAWDEDPKGGSASFTRVAYAQNPFSWHGAAPDGGTALCLAGKPFWEDYTCSVAVRPGWEGAAGVAVNMSDAEHGLLVRWSSIADRETPGGQLALYQLDAGKQTLLASDHGGYLPEQWYKLTVVSALGSIKVLVDGQPRLSADNVTSWRGGIGLYTEGMGGALFDTVTVYGRTLKTDLIMEHRLARINQRFQEDKKGMGDWAAAQSDWTPITDAAGQSWRRHKWDFFGDHWMTLAVTPTDGTGEICLELNGNAAGGYRLILQRAGTAILSRGTAVLARQTLSPLTTGTTYALRFAHLGQTLSFTLDGRLVLQVDDPQPLPGLRPAYRASGSLAAVQDALVVGRNVLDYSFSDAPTDWRGEGAWMPTTRWACSPRWSFLGGWSRGDAVLWHKQRFDGDQSFEAVIAVKMEYPRQHQDYGDRYRDLSVTICGDGRDPRNGYAAVLGAPGATGVPAQRTVLLRNGVVVAETPLKLSFGHTEWHSLLLEKRGAVVTFRIAGQSILSYTDPHPLSGGYPAIWSTDNGISVARARLHFATPPQPPTLPLVALNEPWYPEWANVGRALSVLFTPPVSTTGAPAHLAVETKTTPAAGQPLPVVAGAEVRFTPATAGDYWYRIWATDGSAISNSFHLALPAFTPALGRDDSHAVLLYRFDEGQGGTVRDQSVVSPPANLSITTPENARWLPGQGLHLSGINHLATAGKVSKLLALAQQKAATFEFWLSPDTIFPSTDWLGYLLSWECPGHPEKNLAIAQGAYYFIVMPRGTILVPRGNWYNHPGLDAAVFKGNLPGLQHLVITWDGAQTRCYFNGVLQDTQRIAWGADTWSPDAQLALGNQLNPQAISYNTGMAHFYGVATYILDSQASGQHAFLGSYYLVAVHDRCLTSAQIQRHYRAGPSAR